MYEQLGEGLGSCVCVCRGGGGELTTSWDLFMKIEFWPPYPPKKYA